MHHHSPPRLTWLKQGSFPPAGCVVRTFIGTISPSDFSRSIGSVFALSCLYQAFRRAVDPPPREISLVALMAVPTFRSPYAEEFFGAALPDSSPLPWPSHWLKCSALLCSPLGAIMSTLQDSLYGTDCRFAPPSQRDTPLHHLQSPGSSGSLLRGSLAITTTGLSPVSHQNLSRRTSRLMARRFAPAESGWEYAAPMGRARSVRPIG